MRLHPSAFFFGLALGYATPAFADFNSAMTAYEQKQFDVAYAEFRRLAELGDSPSQRNVAVMYARGEQVAKDPVEARAWAALAAEQDTDAAAKLRDAIAAKLDPAGQEQAGARFDSLRAAFGQQALQARLLPVPAEHGADCTVDVIGDAKPLKTVPPEYPRSAARRNLVGYACATFYIGSDGQPLRLRINKTAAQRNDETAEVIETSEFANATLRALKKWRFTPPATPSLREIPASYCIDFKLDESLDWAIREITQFEERMSAAVVGDPQAQFQLANQLELRSRTQRLGEGQRSKLSETAKKLFAMSAFGGDANGQFKLAKDLLTGNQCDKDVTKGISWLTLAAQQGHTESQYLLATRLLHGEGVERNIEKTGQWLKAAAAGGHARAKTDYALYLLRHEPDKKDMAAALLPESPNENNLGELETVALAKAMMGDFDAAVSYQRQALAIAVEIAAEQASRAQVLSYFERHQLPPMVASI